MRAASIRSLGCGWLSAYFRRSLVIGPGGLVILAELAEIITIMEGLEMENVEHCEDKRDLMEVIADAKRAWQRATGQTEDLPGLSFSETFSLINPASPGRGMKCKKEK